MRTPGEDEGMIRERGPWVWSELRGAVKKLVMDSAEQIKDPDVDECFTWYAGYPPAWMCEALGWITPTVATHDHIAEQSAPVKAGIPTLPKLVAGVL